MDLSTPVSGEQHEQGHNNIMLEEYADVMTVDEACEALRVWYIAMYELLNSGALKAFHNGRWSGVTVQNE